MPEGPETSRIRRVAVLKICALTGEAAFVTDRGEQLLRTSPNGVNRLAHMALAEGARQEASAPLHEAGLQEQPGTPPTEMSAQ